MIMDKDKPSTHNLLSLPLQMGCYLNSYFTEKPGLVCRKGARTLIGISQNMGKLVTMWTKDALTS